ncbi:MAG: holo-ACP synthase [Candidatus Brocadiia bacterium]
MIVGVGVDIIKVSRVKRIVEEHGERFLNRVYSEDEISYCRRCARPAERYATRFAAKEAVLKALGVGWQNGTRFHDVEVSNDSLGAPSIALTGRSKEISKQLGVTQIHISLSHDREYAIAHAVAEDTAANK